MITCVVAYETVHERFRRAREIAGQEGCYVLGYEQLTATPREVLATVCALWGIEMRPEILSQLLLDSAL